jgi:hypothetical protein
MTLDMNNNSQHLTYTEKLSLSATMLSSLYMLPAATQAAVVHVTTPLSISIDGARAFDYQPVDWDVDGNSVADFRLEAFRSIFYTGTSTTYGGYSNSRNFGSLQLNSVGLGGQGMVQNVGDFPSEIQDLSLGSNVGPTLAPGRQWGPQTNRVMMSSSSYIGFALGNLYTDGHLIGFNFLGDGGQTIYGWAEVSIDEAALSMTIDQWAYEDSGGSIGVGEISSVPLPPSFLTMLSGLALGAGGVLRGRKLRKAAQDTAALNT